MVETVRSRRVEEEVPGVEEGETEEEEGEEGGEPDPGRLMGLRQSSDFLQPVVHLTSLPGSQSGPASTMPVGQRADQPHAEVSAVERDGTRIAQPVQVFEDREREGLFDAEPQTARKVGDAGERESGEGEDDFVPERPVLGRRWTYRSARPSRTRCRRVVQPVVLLCELGNRLSWTGSSTTGRRRGGLMAHGGRS